MQAKEANRASFGVFGAFDSPTARAKPVGNANRLHSNIRSNLLPAFLAVHVLALDFGPPIAAADRLILFADPNKLNSYLGADVHLQLFVRKPNLTLDTFSVC